MKKVLLLGGDGFLGKNIQDELKANNVKYTVCSKDCADSNSINCDLLESDDLTKTFEGFTDIVYLVTLGAAKESMENPLEYQNKELKIMYKVIEACKNNGIKKIVFASSGGTVYGNCSDEFINESHITVPISYYGLTKLTLERILLLQNSLYGMENVILRISNPFGDYQRRNSSVGVIPIFTQKILNNEEIVIYGDGSNIRDYIDCGNVAKAFLLALNYNVNSNYLPVFNISSKTPLSINDIISIIEDELDKKAIVTHVSQRGFDVNRVCLDNTYSIEQLGNYYSGDVVNDIKNYVRKNKYKGR